MQAVFLLVDGMFLQERKRIAQLAASARLAAVYGFREHVDAGGLISYGVNLADNFRRAATYVVKILKGAKPGDLAVEFPNKLELIINLKTSKALGGRPFADTCQRPLCAKGGHWNQLSVQSGVRQRYTVRPAGNTRCPARRDVRC